MAVIAPADRLQHPAEAHAQSIIEIKSYRKSKSLPDRPVKNAQITAKKLKMKSAITPRAR